MLIDVGFSKALRHLTLLLNQWDLGPDFQEYYMPNDPDRCLVGFSRESRHLRPIFSSDLGYVYTYWGSTLLQLMQRGSILMGLVKPH